MTYMLGASGLFGLLGLTYIGRTLIGGWFTWAGIGQRRRRRA